MHITHRHFVSSGSSGGYAVLYCMYRVLLRIEKVSLRVREPVELRILIRKDHRFFTFCRNEPLRDAEVALTHSAEFLVDAKSPRFEIELQLISGEARKRGGVVPINLKAFTINATHRAEEPIRKTPLANGSVTLELVYMQSEYRLEESLISVERLEEMIGTSRIKGVIDEHEKLIFRNNSLANQVEQLRRANETLQDERRSLRHSLEEKAERLSEDLRIIERTRREAEAGNESDRRRVAEMVEDIQHGAEKKARQARGSSQGSECKTPAEESE